jgi:hypothetical protein
MCSHLFRQIHIDSPVLYNEEPLVETATVPRLAVLQMQSLGPNGASQPDIVNTLDIK